MLNQASNISPDEITGSGTVDLTQSVTFRWQVSGDSPLLAYQIVFYQNNAASTQLATTGKVTLNDPFWGVNYKGETQLFSATLAASFFSGASMTNGNEYKYIITQWYGSGASDYITNTTACLFEGRTTPTLSIDTITSPVTTRSLSITATFAQAEGDSVQNVRWQIAEANNRAAPFLDTGKIWGTGELRVDYDGYFTGTTYSVKCTVETSMGITVSTGWVDFSVSYTVSTPQGQAVACQLENDSAVFLRWGQMETAEGYSIYRLEAGKNVLEKLADVDSTTGQLRDYGVRSGRTYTYYVFPIGTLAYLTDPMVSDPCRVQFSFWSILETEQDANGVYQMQASHLFRMGEGGVMEGEFRNNNTPQFMKNFTRYPTRQPETSNYLTGSVTGYIGSVDWALGGYSDTVDDSDRLFALSNSSAALFLADPKGHLLRIHTSEPISLRIDNKKPVMPQTMTIGWAEIASAEGAAIISSPGGQFYPTDMIITTLLRIEPQSGALIWETPDGYENGSVLSLSSGGALVQTADGSYTAATLTIDYDTGEATATL